MSASLAYDHVLIQGRHGGGLVGAGLLRQGEEEQRRKGGDGSPVVGDRVRGSSVGVEAGRGNDQASFGLHIQLWTDADPAANWDRWTLEEEVASSTSIVSEGLWGRTTTEGKELCFRLRRVEVHHDDPRDRPGRDPNVGVRMFLPNRTDLLRVLRAGLVTPREEGSLPTKREDGEPPGGVREGGVEHRVRLSHGPPPSKCRGARRNVSKFLRTLGRRRGRNTTASHCFVMES